MPTWMNRTKEAEAARMAAARERRQRAGNCIRCGIAADPESTQLCAKHLAAQRAYANARNAKKRAKRRLVQDGREG